MWINRKAVRLEILRRVKTKWPDWKCNRVAGMFLDKVDRAVERIIDEAIDECQPTDLQTFTGRLSAANGPEKTNGDKSTPNSGS